MKLLTFLNTISDTDYRDLKLSDLGHKQYIRLGKNQLKKRNIQTINPGNRI